MSLVTIISDASHCPITKIGGYGFWAVSTRGRHAGSGSFKKKFRGSTPAEASAIVNAVFISLRLGIAAKGDRLLIQTDSLHSIHVFTGVTKKCKDPDTMNAKNELAKLAATHELTFEFRHVRGHTRVDDQRSKAQRHSDLRAKAAMKKARSSAAA
jgi:ribonuclease HI